MQKAEWVLFVFVLVLISVGCFAFLLISEVVAPCSGSIEFREDPSEYTEFIERFHSGELDKEHQALVLDLMKSEMNESYEHLRECADAAKVARNVAGVMFLLVLSGSSAFFHFWFRMRRRDASGV